MAITDTARTTVSRGMAIVESARTPINQCARLHPGHAQLTDGELLEAEGGRPSSPSRCMTKTRRSPDGSFAAQ